MEQSVKTIEVKAELIKTVTFKVNVHDLINTTNN